MTPTLDYIRSKFDEFNRLCFEGKLLPLPFKLSNARTFLGKITFYRQENPDGTWRYYGFTFRISTKIDLPEDVVEDTIIHEMIHYWILSNQMQDTSAHGEIFMRKMQEINIRHNRHIAVTHKITGEQRDTDTEMRLHLICVSRFNNGKVGITIAPRSRLFILWDEMAKFPGVVEQKWVITVDPYFNRIPRSVSPKAYIVPSEQLEAHLQGARELVRRGDTITLK